jgi:hypothetical protein
MLLLASCHDEKDAGKIAQVFGDPNAPIVFNLKKLHPQIALQDVSISVPQFGAAQLVNDNGYILYEPTANFSGNSDQIIVFVNGIHFGAVLIKASNSVPDCRVMAKPIIVEVAKNSDPIYGPVSLELCVTNPKFHFKGYVLSDVFLQNTTNLNLNASASGASFTYTPPKDFTGIVKAIYELGYYEETLPADWDDPAAYNQWESGIIMIDVR